MGNWMLNFCVGVDVDVNMATACHNAPEGRSATVGRTGSHGRSRSVQEYMQTLQKLGVTKHLLGAVAAHAGLDPL